MRLPTPKQHLTLEYVETFLQASGYTPTLRDIAAHFAISVSAAQEHIKALVAKGYLEKAPNGKILHRSQAQAWSPERIPLVAEIAAGTPIAVEDQDDTFLELSPRLFGRGELVAVRVRGDSMSGDAISDGDVAVIRRQAEAQPKEIVAVRIAQSEVSLKRLQIAGDSAHLLSSNPEHKVRIVPAEQIEILGVLAGIVRRSRSQ